MTCEAVVEVDGYVVVVSGGETVVIMLFLFFAACVCVYSLSN